MNDKDTIKQLQHQVDFLKAKLKASCDGFITSDPVVNRVLNKIIKRHKQGMKKFGRTMAENQKPLNEWVKEAQEESIDFIHYLEKLVK
jgi:hypothetical protein|tara:strand:+ start:670 stop:933 length:264 start_codon:yes stop_codon:yes gene_type:complete